MCCRYHLYHHYSEVVSSVVIFRNIVMLLLINRPNNLQPLPKHNHITLSIPIVIYTLRYTQFCNLGQRKLQNVDRTLSRFQADRSKLSFILTITAFTNKNNSRLTPKNLISTGKKNEKLGNQVGWWECNTIMQWPTVTKTNAHSMPIISRGISAHT